MIYEDGAPVWRHIGRAQLTMRPFSDAFLDTYLAERARRCSTTVGAYRIEDGGAQLFSRVRATISRCSGLPLLELLGFLRARGVCVE